MIKNRLILGLALLAACDRGEEPAGYQGVVELDERVLSFEVPGRVVTLPAVRGEQVDPARVLATLDDAQPKASIEMRTAEARAAEERAKLVAAGSRSEDIRAVEAQLRSAKASEQLALKQHKDDAALVTQGAIPRQLADESDARAKAAVSARQSLEQQLRELRSGSRSEEIAGARATASAAEAGVKLEADRATRYQLRSLHAGEILDVHVEAGEVVAAGTPVVTIGDTTHPYVDVFVPQQDIALIKVGVHAQVRVDALPQPLAGTVEHISRRTEFTPRYIFSKQERANLVIRVRIRVEDPQRALHAGTPAFVTIGA